MTLESKIDAIKTAFTPLIGTSIVRYETAELLLSNGEWSDWPDLPIRIYTDRPAMVSVSWTEFEELWLSNDKSLPHWYDAGDFSTDCSTRWIENGIPPISDCISRVIEGVSLGRGEMSVKGEDVAIWTRLLLDFGNRWLEIFNALDENGYKFHIASPPGEFLKCI